MVTDTNLPERKTKKLVSLLIYPFLNVAKSFKEKFRELPIQQRGLDQD